MAASLYAPPQIATSCHKAALWYASHGWPVFPCKPRAKEPLTHHGFKDATVDAYQIAAWWRLWPDANVAIRTGILSNWLVVDIDPRNGGDESLDEIIRQYGRWPDTAEQMTGAGGRHIVFKYVADPVPKTVAPGIDIKGDGGYVLVAPSIHPNGTKYAWDGMLGARALLNLAEAPAWVFGLSPRKPVQSAPPRTGKSAPTAIDRIAEGQRNDKLTSWGGSMRRVGFSQIGIEAALLAENKLRCVPPLPDDEVRKIAGSVSRYQPVFDPAVVNAECPGWRKS